MSNLCLVTGANGHLGNNLVRALIKKGRRVRAGVRDIHNTKPFAELDCEIVYADILDKESLSKAMTGVDTVYQLAAVFKHWSKNPEKDIIQTNVEGTKNVIELAAKKAVKKLIYVSSIAALDHSSTPMNESGWNQNSSNPYYLSKTKSERLALSLAQKYNLWLVSVLPSAIIGANSFGHLTPTMSALKSIISNAMPFDPNFYFNFIDVQDVVEGMILAEEKGKNGERYILANENHTSSTELFDLARSLYPEVKKPGTIPKTMLYILGSVNELLSKITNKPPTMQRNWVKLYYKTDLRCDITKTKQQLGFNPKKPEQAVKQAFQYLKQW